MRSTHTVTVEVTVEGAPDWLKNSTLADQLRDEFFRAIEEDEEIGTVVVMEVRGTDAPKGYSEEEIVAAAREVCSASDTPVTEGDYWVCPGHYAEAHKYADAFRKVGR